MMVIKYRFSYMVRAFFIYVLILKTQNDDAPQRMKVYIIFKENKRF